MAEYLKYILKTVEPIRIADDSKSQSGQTDTLRYIPGSTVRGLVVNACSTDDGFDEMKKALFTDDTVFTNAYLTMPTRSLIPSPKGFYEDKSPAENGEKKIENVVISGDFSEGMKRASLGRCCYIKNDCICYYSVKTGSDLKLLINPQEDAAATLFRNEYIAPGQFFEGYIKLNEKVRNAVCAVFQKDSFLKLGNARSAGLGRCLVYDASVVSGIPYGMEAFDAENECYMLLLSDTVMRSDAGEYCGLNLDELSELFKVDALKIEYASTSTRTVHGYNRTMKTHMPSLTAYEAGSVFHFTYKGTLSGEVMLNVMNEGIGVKKNEGMGRVAFLDGYEKICRKLSCEPAEEAFTDIAALTKDDEATLRTVARKYLRNEIKAAMRRFVIDPDSTIKKGALKTSRLGTVESILMKFRYAPTGVRESLEEYFGHALEKENNRNIQKTKASITPLERYVSSILDEGRPLVDILFRNDKPFAEEGRVMGFTFSELMDKETEDRYRIELLIDVLRFDSKKEV